MRKLIIGMALASSALASPAFARDDAWYIEGGAGPMIVEDTKFDVGTTNDAVSIDHHIGGDAGASIGYDFGGFRLEAEASYKKANPKSLTSTVTVPAIGTTTSTSAPAGTYDYVGGRADNLAFMLNGLLDFGADDGVQGFIGAGAGIGRAHYRYAIRNSAPGFLDDSDSGFAWQALAGVRAPLTDTIDVGLKYRFFNQNNVDLVDSAGRAVSTKWRSHSLLGTITFNFGGAPEVIPVPPPPPPPPPAPPPPPPPVVATCNKGPYIVFFDWDKSDITPEAASILDSAVTAYGSCDRIPIMLAGYADRSGTVQYNLGLSARRNDSVRAYLTSHGIPDGSITSQAFGESNPRVPTADGVRELQNRRVEITYGPGSGM